MRRFFDSNFDKSLELLESFSGEDRNLRMEIRKLTKFRVIFREFHRQVARGGVVERLVVILQIASIGSMLV